MKNLSPTCRGPLSHLFVTDIGEQYGNPDFATATLAAATVLFQMQCSEGIQIENRTHNALHLCGNQQPELHFEFKFYFSLFACDLARRGAARRAVV